MKKTITTLIAALTISGCNKLETEVMGNIDATPLVLKARVDLKNVDVKYGEKYFAVPVTRALAKAPEIARVHAYVFKNALTVDVYFSGAVTYTHGKNTILNAFGFAQKKIPQVVKAEITEINPDEMTAIHKAMIADLKGINIEQTLESDLKSSENKIFGKFPLSFDDFDPNNEPCECEESACTVQPGPLYVIESTKGVK